MTKIAVIGSGSMGTCIAHLLAGKGNDVYLWSHNAEHATYINEHHCNPVYLPDYELQGVYASASLEEVCSGAESVLMVTPSVYVRNTSEQLAPFITDDTPVAILSKGIEENTGFTMADILEDTLGNVERIAAVSGPNHAEEIIANKLTCTTVASLNENTARYFQELLSAPYFRVYTSDDVIGVEMCGAAKNIIAIANGVVCALDMGDNLSSALITRGLAEICRLVLALGGQSHTCLGLSGVGDLIATCTSPHSRNRRLGTMLAQGGTLEQFEQETHMVAEGAVACRTVTDLARQHDVDMPIAETVRKVMTGELAITTACDMLFARPNKPEFESED